MTDRDLLEAAGRLARAIAALDGRRSSLSTAVELYGLLRELESSDRSNRLALISEMLGLPPALRHGKAPEPGTRSTGMT
jgi:hypothetical protein